MAAVEQDVEAQAVTFSNEIESLLDGIEDAIDDATYLDSLSAIGIAQTYLIQDYLEEFADDQEAIKAVAEYVSVVQKEMQQIQEAIESQFITKH